MSEVLKEALKRIDKGEVIALVTIVEAEGSTPRERGAKMAVGRDGLISGTIGGGIVEAKVIEAAKKAIKRGKKQSLHYNLNKEETKLDEGAICGGELKIFIDILKPKEEIIIFGAGHIGFYLSKLAKIIGIKVSIVDERMDFANRERFPEAEQIITEKAGIALNQVKITPSSYVVIVTKGHQHDEEALLSVINRNVGYIGMIGSGTKNEVIFQHLREKGITEGKIKKVFTPIGIDIGAQTPEEIAVSIIAEIIQVKRNKVYRY
jgi:xanthine dehydrogenase accessory factor